MHRQSAIGLGTAILFSTFSWTASPLAAETPGENGTITSQTIVQLRLRNGSRLQGTLGNAAALELKTPYGKLTIPIEDVRSWVRGKSESDERPDRVVTKHGTYVGWLTTEESYQIDTGFGVLEVPAEAIQQLSARSKERGDDFESSGDLFGWTVMGGSWRVQDGRLRTDGVPGNYLNQIHWDEEMEGPYTLEATVSGSQQMGVVWNARDSSTAYVLWIAQGTIYVYGGSNWWNSNTASWSAPVPADGNYRVRIEVDGQNSTVSVNGTRLGDVSTQWANGKVGCFVYQGSASFDDFWIEEGVGGR